MFLPAIIFAPARNAAHPIPLMRRLAIALPTAKMTSTAADGRRRITGGRAWL